VTPPLSITGRDRPNRDLDRLRSHPAFEFLKRRAIAMTGMAFYADRDETLAAAVARRMSALSLTDAGSYLDRLEGAASGEERDALTEELTIGETYFLRHTGQWTAFTDRIIPDILVRNADRKRLVIWSAGCSTGAEPYTASILLRDRFGDRLDGWDVSILGTDINRRFLSAARQARFGAWSFRAMPDDQRQRWFTRIGDHWELKARYREGVEFQHHNLVRDRIPPGGIRPDLIMCRNVFIYFDGATNATVVDAFHKTLGDGGWLLVGHAEPDLRTFRAFEPILLPDAVLYRKPVPGEARPADARPVPPAISAPAGARPTARKKQSAAPTSSSVAVRTPAPPKADPPEAPLPPLPAAPALEPGTPEAQAVADLMSRGEWGAATAACLRWLERDAMDPWVHVCLGLLHEQSGRTAQAVEAHRRAVYLDRTALIAHYQLGCLKRRSDPGAARRRFRNVLDLSQDLPPELPVKGAPGLTVEELRQAALMQMTRLEGA